MSHTTFDSLPASLAPPSPPSSPLRRRRHWAKRLERCCCRTFAYFPLLFVYGLTTWAVWVEVSVAFFGTSISGVASASLWSWVKAALGVVLWGLLNSCYSVAVFTSPGSPVDERADFGGSSGRKGRGRGRGRRGGYEGLPMLEDEEGAEHGAGEGGMRQGMTMVTAKSTGQPRYCKKCATIKPDRTHHCSSCGRCVLKMDHHCPWLATCVGLHNYKPFLLFLIYTSLFCWLCFGISASWVWAEIIDETEMQEGMKVVNTILLAVLGGIIGLVLSGFTGWHIYLALTGQTTIESLEKTRYLAPLRKSMEIQNQNGRNYLDQQNHQAMGLTDQLKEIHANALPGILRFEEGQEEEEEEERNSRHPTPTPPTSIPSHPSSTSPAKHSLQRSYASLEAQRERDRYAAYLDEVDSEKLPNAFDLGWKRNFLHVFGDSPLLWFSPMCNTSGDGWAWETNPKWEAARDELVRQRAVRQREEAAWGESDGGRGYGYGDGNGNDLAQTSRFQAPPPPPRRDYRWTAGQGFVNPSHNHHYPPPGQRPHDYHSSLSASDSEMQLQPLDRRKGGGVSGSGSDADSYDTSSSDEEIKRMYAHPQIQGMDNWNDVPDDFLSAGRMGGSGRGRGQRSRSRGRRKGD